MTPHISAKKGEIAKLVLMPGDPLRAKYIAKNFLTNVKCVNTVRNMFMYTGKYNNELISICGSGMGCASIGIYSYELFKFYDVDKIIRVGSAGAYTKKLDLFQTVLVKDTYSDSTLFSELMLNNKKKIINSSSSLNKKIQMIAKKLKISLLNVRSHTSDVFYSHSKNVNDFIKTTNSDCVEMESYALFVNAKATNKKAATLLTISDNLITNQKTTALERQTAFNNMIKIALELVK